MPVWDLYQGWFGASLVVYKDVIDFYYKETNEMFGTDYEPPK